MISNGRSSLANLCCIQVRGMHGVSWGELAKSESVDIFVSG